MIENRIDRDTVTSQVERSFEEMIDSFTQDGIAWLQDMSAYDGANGWLGWSEDPATEQNWPENFQNKVRNRIREFESYKALEKDHYTQAEQIVEDIAHSALTSYAGWSFNHPRSRV